jgi:hypothetical protein
MTLPSHPLTLQDRLYAFLSQQQAGENEYFWKGKQTGVAGSTDIAGDAKVIVAGEVLKIRDVQVGGDVDGNLEIKVGSTVYGQWFFDANTNYGTDFDLAIQIAEAGTVVATLTTNDTGTAFAVVNISKA